MIEVVKENPCKDCGIKGLYENCSEKCVQYRKYFQYKQGRADAIDDCIKMTTDERLCQIFEQLKE